MKTHLSPLDELEKLAELYDEEFVVAAYRAILGRTPDAGGLNNYLSQVRSGVNKLEIVAELAQSAEGRSRTPPPQGLKEFIRKHSVRRRNFLGRFRRPHEGQILALARQLRAVDNHLYLLKRDLTARFNSTADFIRLMQPAAVLRQKVGDDSNPVARSQSNLRLPPKLSKTFSDLMSAISARR